MFDNCDNLQRPNSNEQSLILNGTNWINLTECPTKVPYAPRNLQASNNYIDKVLLIWENPIDDGMDKITEFNIYRDDVLIAENVISPYTDVNVESWRNYEYYVEACNDEGCKKSNTDIGTAVDKNSNIYVRNGNDPYTRLPNECGIFINGIDGKIFGSGIKCLDSVALQLF
jgi:hypothetical protein